MENHLGSLGPGEYEACSPNRLTLDGPGASVPAALRVPPCEVDPLVCDEPVRVEDEAVSWDAGHHRGSRRHERAGDHEGPAMPTRPSSLGGEQWDSDTQGART